MTTSRSRYTPTRRAARRSTPPASSSTSTRRLGKSSEIDEDVSSSSAESEGEEWNSKNDTPKIQQKWGRTKEAGGSRARSEDSDDKPMARKGLRSRSRSRSGSRRRVQVKEEDEKEEEEESILSSDDELLLKEEEVPASKEVGYKGKRGPVTYVGKGRQNHQATRTPEDDDDPEHDEDPEKGKPEDGEQDEAENDANAKTEDEAEPQITETQEPAIDLHPVPARQGRIRRPPDRYIPEEQVGQRRQNKAEQPKSSTLAQQRKRQSSDTSSSAVRSGTTLDDAIARSKRVLKASSDAKDEEDEGREAAPSPDSTPPPTDHRDGDQETTFNDLKNGGDVDQHDQPQAGPSGTASPSKAKPDPGAKQPPKSVLKRTRSILSINDNGNEGEAKSSSPKKKKEVKIDTKNLSIRLITPSTSSGSDRIKIASAQLPAPARGKGRGPRGGKRRAVPRTAPVQAPQPPLVHPKRKHSNWNLARNLAHAEEAARKGRLEAALLAYAEPSNYPTKTSTSSDIDPPRREFVVSSSSSSGSTSRQGIDASIKGPRPRSFSRLRARSGLFSRYPGLDLLARAGELEKLREAEREVDEPMGCKPSQTETAAPVQSLEDRGVAPTARPGQIRGQGPMYSDLVNLKDKGDDQWDRLIALTDCALDVWAKKHKTILKQVEIINPPIHSLNTDEIEICGVAEADGMATNSNSNTSTDPGIDVDIDTRGEEISDPALIQRPGLDFEESLRRLMADYQARVDRLALAPGPEEARARAPAYSPTPTMGAVGTSRL